jgi:hypothetical protein
MMMKSNRINPMSYSDTLVLVALYVTMALMLLGLTSCANATDAPDAAGDRAPGARPGTMGLVGCTEDPKRVRQLVIDQPGIYENYLVDGNWNSSTLVKITADNVTLRNCEIRNGTHNAVVVYAKDVVIESCKIHHVLKGTFDQQQDAHGITGRPQGLVIRNCDIGLTSGDSVQFDPGRGIWDNVLIEHCNLWTGPLPADAAGFKKGQRPGENAVDTKQSTANPRSRLTIRNCLIYGWNQPAQINNMAALNLKNHVEVTVENCVLRDNEICFRVRGGTGELGGAQVTIDRCAVYDSTVAIRAENQPQQFTVRRLGIGHGIERVLRVVGGGTESEYQKIDTYSPPSYEQALEAGLPL